MNNKSLSGSVAWYALGNLIVRSLGFILLPLYSNLITTSEFGNYALLMSVYTIMSVFFQFGMFGALNKFYIEEKSEEKKFLIFSSILNTIIIIGVVLTTVLWQLSPVISRVVFNTNAFSGLLTISFVAVLFETIGSYILFLLKTTGYAKKVVIYSAVGALFNLGLNVIFVYSLRLSVYGIILAQVISGIFMVLILLPFIKDKYHFTIERDIIKVIIKFSVPLLFANLFMAGSNVADRFILNIYSGREQVGLYSFSYRIAIIMSILVASFSTAWNPHSLNLYYSSDYKISFGKILNKLVAISCLLLLVVSLLAQYLFNIHVFNFFLFNPAYKAGIVIIPFVMIGYIFNGISAYYSVYPSVSNKSYHILISEMIAFSFNVFLNIILIPKIGLIGAAFATAAGFLSGSAYLFIISRREIKIEYQLKDLLIIIIAALLFLSFGMNVGNFLLDIMLILFYLFILHFFTKIKLNQIFRIA